MVTSPDRSNDRVADMSGRAATAIRDAVAAVVDPEIVVITIDELGILRDVEVDDDGHTVITITPTYSGCPAMDMIRGRVATAARDAGASVVEVRTVLAPAWTTDWISESGRAKLAAAAIAPPASSASNGPVPLGLPTVPVTCPRCGSRDTEELSRFGSTACKALWRCRACAEPFDYVKAF
jgi:ring-1,2-phenylacetyl-CoA epoxidase subunit PaaD